MEVEETVEVLDGVVAAALWVSHCLLPTMTTPPASPQALLPQAMAVEAEAVAMAYRPLLTTTTTPKVAAVAAEEEGGVEEEEEEEAAEVEGVETRTLTLHVARQDCFRRPIGPALRVVIPTGPVVRYATCAVGRSRPWQARARRGRG